MNGVGRVFRLAFALSLVISLGVIGQQAHQALAAVSVGANPSSVVFPNTSVITVGAVESDGGNGPITLSVLGGTLTLLSCQTTVPCTTGAVSGSGTSTLTISGATDGDLTAGEPLTVQFLFSPPNVGVATAVAVSACQGNLCSPVFAGNINVFPSGTSSATNITLSSTAGTVLCGGSLTITATVSTNGVAVADGTVVVFSANNGVASVASSTVGGVAAVTIVVPSAFTGPLVVTATSGGISVSGLFNVSCATGGPPAQISLTITPSSITCGSTASVLATVTDQFGNQVANGTIVNFKSTLGSIPSTAPIIAGIADAVLTSFPQQPGTSTITVTAGTASTTGIVQITCQAPAQPTAVPPTVAPTARPPTAVLPPSTGDAGLKGSSSSWALFAIGGLAAFALVGLATVRFTRRVRVPGN